MDFNQANDVDIILESRGAELADTPDDGTMGEEEIAEMLLKERPLTLDDVEAYAASGPGLIACEETLSTMFDQAHWGMPRDDSGALRLAFSIFVDNEQRSGTLHMLQAADYTYVGDRFRGII